MKDPLHQYHWTSDSSSLIWVSSVIPTDWTLLHVNPLVLLLHVDLLVIGEYPEEVDLDDDADEYPKEVDLDDDADEYPKEVDLDDDADEYPKEVDLDDDADEYPEEAGLDDDADKYPEEYLDDCADCDLEKCSSFTYMYNIVYNVYVS